MEIAAAHARGRVVSVLEGGYDLEGLVALGRRACHGANGGVKRPPGSPLSGIQANHRQGSRDPPRGLRRQARRNDRRRLARRAVPTKPSPIIAQVESSGVATAGELASMSMLGVVSNP